PMNVKVKVWTSVEVNGYIFVWHHVLNEPPSWELVPVPEIASKEWAYCGRTDHTILAHPQEILENAADLTHLPEIHTAPFISSNFALLNRIKKWKIFEHNWAAQWSEGPAPHQITIILTGPAHVEIFFESDGFLGKLKGAYMEFVTPISPLKNRIVYHTWIERKGILSYLMGKFLLYAEAKMTYLERPVTL
ncbi:PREDICTED: cholesterol 7-desaturase-like, partial [Rhagoletis zephyria]|uniref:cholesterol 7-desaturase-like n=1 Tax=Rhagoletis zephyria TaxID=28612 RepID=UPI0008112986